MVPWSWLITPTERPVLPPPTGSAVSTATLSPASAASNAVTRPTMPAPTMIVSYGSSGAGMAVTLIGGTWAVAPSVGGACDERDLRGVLVARGGGPGDGDARAGLRRVEAGGQVGRGADRVAVDRGDGVTLGQSGGRRRRAAQDGSDDRTARAAAVPRHLDAEEGRVADGDVGRVRAGLDRAGDAHGRGDRDRVAGHVPHAGAGGGVDADHLAGAVQHRAARVAGDDVRVGLDQA